MSAQSFRFATFMQFSPQKAHTMFDRAFLQKTTLCLLCWQLILGTVALARDEQTATNSELQLVLDTDGFNGSPIQCLAISNDGTWLAAAADKVVRVWNLKSNEQLAPLRGYQEPYGFLVGRINALTFSPDSRFLLVGVTDNTEAGSTRIYDLSNKLRFHSLVEGHLGCTRGITFSPDGRRVATWGCDGQIIVLGWDQRTGTASKQFVTHWNLLESLSPKLQDRLNESDQWRDQAFKLGNEGKIAQMISLIEKKLAFERQILGNDHRRLLNTLNDLAYIYEINRDDVAAHRIKDEMKRLEKLNGELLEGGCFCFADNEHVVFSHCKSERIVSTRLQRNLFSDERPAFIVQVEREAKQLLKAINGDAKLSGEGDQGVYVDLNAFQVGRGPWIGQCLKIFHPSSNSFDYEVVLWARNNSSLIRHSHDFHPVAVTFNPTSQLGASSDRLGYIHVWNLQNGKSVRNQLAPNALRLWSVDWEHDALYFSDKSYSQRDFADNHRGPINGKFDLTQMAIVPLENHPAPRIVAETFFKGHWISLKNNYDVVSKTWKLNVNRGTRNWPVAVNFSTVETDSRPIRRLPNFTEAWSYCFVQYPEMRDEAHVLVGTANGYLFEAEISENRGDLEMQVVREYLGHTGGVTSIAVSPDGRRFATSSLDGTLRIWALNRPRNLFDLGCLTDGSRIVVSRDKDLRPDDVLQGFGKYTYFERIKPILRGEFLQGQEVSVRLSRQMITHQNGNSTADFKKLTESAVLQPSPDLAEPILSVFLSQDGEWVVWNDQGFYNASANGARHLGFHRNRARHLPAEFYTSDQFHDFYRPNVILEAFRSLAPIAPIPAPFPTATLRNDVLAVNEESNEQLFEEIVPPRVTIKEPANNALIHDGSIPVEVEVGIPIKRRLTDVQVKFNELVLPAERKANSEKIVGNLQFVTYSVKPELEAGDYAVVALAQHEVAKSMSEPRKIQVQQEASQSSSQPRLYVLSIGIGKYKDPTLAIEGAAHDATRVADELMRNRGKLFQSVEATVIVDESCTGERVYKAFDWLKSKAKKNHDLAIVFINAHFLQADATNWYLAPFATDPSALRTTAIPSRELSVYMDAIPRAVLWLDVFHLPPSQASNGNNPFHNSNKATILACSQLQSSQPGIFASAIVEVLSKPRDRDLRLDSFISEVAASTTAQSPSRQRPIEVIQDKSQKAYVLAH